MINQSRENMIPEKISPFLKKKMEKIKQEKGVDSGDYMALLLQYKKLDKENNPAKEANDRHWEANLEVEMDGESLKGIERLYKRSVVIEPTMICAARCRYCLRAHYGMFTLDEADLEKIARYCGSKELKEEVQEVLITGGDPFIVPQRLNFLIESLAKYAPNVKIARIATRLFTQDPQRIGNNLLEIFKKKLNIRFEIATQINHVSEFFPETIQKLRVFQDMGVHIYSQNVLLRGVNDNIEALIELYNAMRIYGIEAHYLFHCLPMKGMHHLRSSLTKGLELTKQLVNSGVISGRAKPMYAAMTDIGKITLYEGTILGRDKLNRVLLQSNYRYNDRVAWNHDWQLPNNAEVDEKGFLRIWYLDGNDK
jgi:lysine 2,3-aminomutase